MPALSCGRLTPRTLAVERVLREPPGPAGAVDKFSENLDRMRMGDFGSQRTAIESLRSVQVLREPELTENGVARFSENFETPKNALFAVLGELACDVCLSFAVLGEPLCDVCLCFRFSENFIVMFVSVFGSRRTSL
jgi:hypothetical protein